MKSYRIRNIKSFVDSGEIEIAPITVFVGKNSCGKSSLIRFPAVLSQTFIAETDNPLKFYGKLLDYGNYEDVIHGHGDGDISFEVKYNVDLNSMPLMSSSMARRFGLLDNDSENRKKGSQRTDVTLDVTIGRENRSLIVKSFSLYREGETIYQLEYTTNNEYRFSLYSVFKNKELTSSERKFSFILKDIEFEGVFPQFQFSEVENIDVDSSNTTERLHLSTARIFEYERRLRTRFVENPRGDATKEESFLFDVYDTLEYLRYVTASFCRLMNYEANELSYIGPFRENPERIYRDQEKRSTFVGTKGENISTLLINDSHKDMELINRISDWLWNSMGYRISIKDVSSGLFQIVVEDEKGFQSNILDVGYGISQVLPIVAEIFRSQDEKRRRYVDSRFANTMLIVEQPELHLHPAAQSDLADLLVEYTRDSNKRILVETHSEHLIRKLQVLIAKKDCSLTNQMVRVYYVDKNEQGDAFVEEMCLLENGKFEEQWPSGFFDKGYLLSRELARNAKE